MKRILASLAIVAVLAVLLWLRIAPQHSSADPVRDSSAPVSPEWLTVNGHVVVPQVFRERVVATGNILADEEIYIQPEASGRITGIFFEEDSYVDEGDLLVRLNDAELQQEKRRVTYQINLAEIREQRQEELLRRNAISQEDYDVALNELNTLRAQRDRIRAQIDKMEILAPFYGRVGLREISVGSYVSPQSVISSLQKIDPIKIEFSVPERYRSLIQRDQPVRFRVEGSDEWYQGRIYAIQPRVDRQTRTVRIRALAPNPGDRILPGGFAHVELDLNLQEQALLIPSEALVPDITGYQVFTFIAGRTALKRVEIGTRTDRSVVIRSGLDAGDTVITSGLLQIREGMPVRVHIPATEDQAP